MYRAKQIDRQKVIELFYYDESSKSCLKWAKDRYTGQYRSRLNVKRGQDVGAISGNYYITTINKQKMKVHRLVYTLCIGDIPTGMCVEHINGDGTDNRVANLRLASRSHNMQNRKVQYNSKTGIAGVEYVVRQGRSPYYSASWYDLDGKHRRKTFATSIYGEEGAKAKAIEARLQFIDILNANGRAYTERHVGEIANEL